MEFGNVKQTRNSLIIVSVVTIVLADVAVKTTGSISIIGLSLPNDSAPIILKYLGLVILFFQIVFVIRWLSDKFKSGVIEVDQQIIKQLEFDSEYQSRGDEMFDENLKRGWEDVREYYRDIEELEIRGDLLRKENRMKKGSKVMRPISFVLDWLFPNILALYAYYVIIF